jgi:anti-sigma28 factor (negative regulator of flagellin synthesis)
MESFESSTLNNISTQETAVSTELETKAESEPVSETAKITAEEMIMQEIEELATPLIEKMKEKIDEGAYDLIVSDEGSGRLPTLLFRKIYRARNPGKDFDTIFVNGSRERYDPVAPALVNFFSKYAAKGRSKALVVTDYVHLGTSLGHFLKNLNNANITDVSVAALRTSYDEHVPDSKAGKIIAEGFTDFFEGEINKGKVPLVASLKDVSRAMHGVIKKNEEAPRKHPERIKKSDFNGGKVVKAREDIGKIAERILEKVWGKTETHTTEV